MIFDGRLFVECNPDELLVRKLGVPKRKIIHSSKGEICKRLSKKVLTV